MLSKESTWRLCFEQSKNTTRRRYLESSSLFGSRSILTSALFSSSSSLSRLGMGMGYTNNNNNLFTFSKCGFTFSFQKNQQQQQQQQQMTLEKSKKNQDLLLDDNNFGRFRKNGPNSGFSRGGGYNNNYGGGSGNGGGFRKSEFAFSNIEWNKETVTPFRKDFYQEHSAVTQRSDSDIKKLRDDSKMLVFGQNIPKPFQTWEESGIPAQYLKSLKHMGIQNPTPIQQQGIPMALSGRDVIGISRTGSGKTLTYLLPLLVHVEAQAVVKEGDGPIGLIIGPTRELVQQINDEMTKYTRANPDIIMKHTAVYGGANREQQIAKLMDYPDILVATPGRLLDLVSNGLTNFKRTTYLVLDEADRMLDMGFRSDLETILSYVRPDKQILMWSATWPHDIAGLAHNYMKNPIRVQIGSVDLLANDQIEQNFKYLQPFQKVNAFIADIKEITESGNKCLVFVNTKKTADLLAKMLGAKNIRAQAIHGDKSQLNRDNTLHQFRTGKANVLIATDVVARGIDIRDINVVLVYDFPKNVEDYVHRIGRTARGLDRGIALSYLTDDDLAICGSPLIKVLQKSKQEIPDFLKMRRAR